MKRALLILIICVGVIFIFRLRTSYAIIYLPKFFGMEVFTSGDKHRFRKCVVNPLKSKPLRELIENRIKTNMIEVYKTKPHKDSDKEHRTILTPINQSDFINRLDEITGIKIVSFLQSHGELKVLIEAKDMPGLRCVAVFDSKDMSFKGFIF
jgi:hypothetical protein